MIEVSMSDSFDEIFSIFSLGGSPGSISPEE